MKNYEELYLTENLFTGKKVILDHNMYTFNDVSKSAFFEHGVSGDTVPLELNSREIMHRKQYRLADDSLWILSAYDNCQLCAQKHKGL